MAFTSATDIEKLKAPLKSPSYPSVVKTSPLGSRMQTAKQLTLGDKKNFFDPPSGVGKNPLTPQIALLPEPALITTPVIANEKPKQKVIQSDVNVTPLITPKKPIFTFGTNDQKLISQGRSVPPTKPGLVSESQTGIIPNGNAVKWVNIGTKSEGFIDASGTLVYANYEASVRSHNLSAKGDSVTSKIGTFKTNQTVIVPSADNGLINNDATIPAVGSFETVVPDVNDKSEITSNDEQQAGFSNWIVIIALVGLGVSLLAKAKV